MRALFRSFGLFLRGLRWVAYGFTLVLGNRFTGLLGLVGALYVIFHPSLVFPPGASNTKIIGGSIAGFLVPLVLCKELAPRLRPRKTRPQLQPLPVVIGIKRRADDPDEALIIGRLSPKLQSLLLPPMPRQPSPRPAAPAAADTMPTLSTSAGDEITP